MSIKKLKAFTLNHPIGLFTNIAIALLQASKLNLVHVQIRPLTSLGHKLRIVCLGSFKVDGGFEHLGKWENKLEVSWVFGSHKHFIPQNLHLAVGFGASSFGNFTKYPYKMEILRGPFALVILFFTLFLGWLLGWGVVAVGRSLCCAPPPPLAIGAELVGFSAPDYYIIDVYWVTIIIFNAWWNR